ncbi:uncharacterized protein LOC134529444 [Bacillus rossius redtenbacheri]|uniref:uncharacterized protein LOC134529444 n=1 Tax=Bacillus rossius redtenbacheri TaxID=93214 RepID=UPI002FDD3D33
MPYLGHKPRTLAPNAGTHPTALRESAPPGPRRVLSDCRGVVTSLALLLVPVAAVIRMPRSLVFIDGGTYKFQYTLPDNITEFTTVSSRSLRNAPTVFQTNNTNINSNTTAAEGGIIHRGVIYRSLESALSRKGVDGRACVLRSICEAAETPLHHDGLIGELLHTVLTPDYGSSSVELIDADYLKAQQAGRRGRVDCNYLYPECPRGFGLLDLFTFQQYL